VSTEAFYETADDAIRSSLRLLHQICNIFGIAWDDESLQFDFFVQLLFLKQTPELFPYQQQNSPEVLKMSSMASL